MLSVSEVSERLGMSEAFVRRAIKSGHLSAQRFGRSIRVSEYALQSYQTANSVLVSAEIIKPANDNNHRASPVAREASGRLRSLIG